MAQEMSSSHIGPVPGWTVEIISDLPLQQENNNETFTNVTAYTILQSVASTLYSHIFVKHFSINKTRVSIF